MCKRFTQTTRVDWLTWYFRSMTCLSQLTPSQHLSHKQHGQNNTTNQPKWRRFLCKVRAQHKKTYNSDSGELIKQESRAIAREPRDAAPVIWHYPTLARAGRWSF